MKRTVLIPLLLSTFLLVGCGEIPEDKKISQQQNNNDFYMEWNRQYAPPENNQKSLKNKEALEALYEVSTLCTAVYGLTMEDGYDLVKEAEKDKATCIANAVLDISKVVCEIDTEGIMAKTWVEMNKDKAIEYSSLATRVSQDLFPKKSSKFIKNKERKKVDEYKKKFKRSGGIRQNEGDEMKNCMTFREEYDQYF